MRQTLVLLLVLAAPFCAQAQQGAAGPKRLIVGFKADVDAAAQEDILKRFNLAGVEAIDGLNARVVEAPASSFAPTAVRLMSDPAVYYVEEDFYTNWLKAAAPAAFSQLPMPDLGRVMAELPKLVQRNASQGELPWGVVAVNAKGAWDRGVDGRGVRVAVIDTGIDCSHPDLAANCAKDGYNAVDSKKPPKDDHSHGTHVSGTIAAVKDGKGVVGIAPAATLVPVKVLDAQGGGSLTSIIKGLVWVGQHDIAVANMSLGSETGSVFMRLAVTYARMKGVVVMAAAGNSGGSVGYPAAYPDAIAVAASDADGKIADFSSRGKQVAFIAPGVDVNSTIPGGGYERYSGTSMATPHMTGLAALAIQQGAKGKDAVLAALQHAAKPLPGLKPEEQGVGMVDAGTLKGR